MSIDSFHPWCLGRQLLSLAGAILLSGTTLAHAQDLVVRTSASPASISATAESGKSHAVVNQIARTPELLILLSQEALKPEDLAPLQTFVIAVFQELHSKVGVRIGVINGGKVDMAGPIHFTREIRTILRTIRPDSAQPGAPEATSWLDGIATPLESIPSEWGYTLIAGHIPKLPGGTDPDVEKYAIAYLTRQFIAQKRSLLFWEPGTAPPAEWTQILSRDTGGFSFQQPEGLAGSLSSQETSIGITLNLQPPSRGFRLDSISGDNIPELASVSTPLIVSGIPKIPSIAEFAELRRLTAGINSVVADQNADITRLTAARDDLKKALNINPADWTAVRLGIALTDRQRDVEAEIPLLEEAVELMPRDANYWVALGNLQYERKDFVPAEASLLRARQLGATGARICEQLGRIRYAGQDYAHAETLIDESLSLNAAQQPLWLLAAGIAKATGNTDKQVRSLERALALGGLNIEQRAELIGLYLAKGDKDSAARHTDNGLLDLPAEPDIQTTWAQFYERLLRPDDALARWSKVIEIDPQREGAHSAICRILLDQKRYPAALAAAQRGLEYAGDSPRLQLAEAIALEHLDRVYEARRALDSFTAKTDDIDLLNHKAEVSDAFGGNAPATYRRLAEVLGKNGSQNAAYRLALERGWKVSLRDSDAAAAAWFVSRISGKPEAAAGEDAKQSNGVWIPGGLDALMFAARGPAGRSPDRFVLDYCRVVLANESSFDQAQSNFFRKSMSSYFTELKTLLGTGVRVGDKSIITLSIADKRNEKQTEVVLALLGWRLRRNRQQIAIESDEKESQAGKQDLAAALAIDQGGMQSAFQAGKPFRIEIQWDWAPLAMDGRTLWQLAQADKLAGGLPEAFVANPDLARFYSGMTNLNRETADALMSSISVVALASRFSSLFAFYSSALAVSGGRVLAPGGTAADPVWIALTGVAPSDPTGFLRVLFERNDGKLLAFFNALSELDSAHQHFFTLSAKRASGFYQLFSESEEVRSGLGKRTRKGSFVEFLRDVPLNNDGSVNFPGSAEVWTIAKGDSKTPGQSEKMLRKVRKAVAPDVEDAILLRIASTRYKIGGERLTELDNFLAVAHIDAHRSEPLDEQSALLLAQNLAGFGSFYPYFAVFPTLTAADLTAVFSLGAKLTSMDALDADLAMGQFFPLVEMIRLGLEFGKIPEQRAITLFRSLCTRFLAARNAADFTSASLDSVRDMIGSASAPDADQALAMLMLGNTSPVAFELNGVEHSLDPGHEREVAYGRVLNLQKTPSVSALLRIETAARSIPGVNVPVEPPIAALLKDAASLPVVEVPKSEKFQGRSKQAIERYDPARLLAIVTELREKMQRRKAGPKELEKLAREILVEIGPQVRLALTGIVYGAYLSPEDTLAANDPLLLRKHQSFELHPTGSTKPAFVQSDLVLGSSNGGSYFVGGFAYFAHTAGNAAALSVRKGNADAQFYALQVAATRTTAWSRYRDEDQRLLGLRIRLAREWLVYANSQPAFLRDLSDDTLGVLSLSRRRELLNGIASQDWKAVWNSVTLSDLLFLADRYVVRYKQSPWISPVDAALREASARNDGSRLNLLGPVPLSLYGCNHPHLLALAPYEEYENHLFAVELAERTAEMKLYLSELMDRLGLPAAALQAIAEPAAKIAFGSIHMSDGYDWAQALAVFHSMNEKTIEAALEAAK